MIIVRLIGGLGNQMFQYALGRHLAIKNNCTLKLDISGFLKYNLRSYALNSFNIEEIFVSTEDLQNVNFPVSWFKNGLKRIFKPNTSISKIKYIKQQSYDFQPEILTLGDNLYLDGSWQSEKYFLKIKDIIKKDFSIKGKISSQVITYLNEIKKCNSVSVHIRRGDYISNKKTNEFHGSLSIKYYQNAMDLIRENEFFPHFFVFSDDIDWVKHNFFLDYPITFINSNVTSSHEDLFLMSNCKHHIIANSSFSWWGAWLGSNIEKKVIGPSKWFKGIKYNDGDRMPDTWIRISDK